VGWLDRYRYSDFDQPEKDHENVRLFGKGGGGVMGKWRMARRGERERGCGKSWPFGFRDGKERVIIEKEKERKKGLSTSEPLFKPRSHPQNPRTPRHKQ